MFSYVTRIWTEIKMIHNYKKPTDEYKRPAENMTTTSDWIMRWNDKPAPIRKDKNRKKYEFEILEAAVNWVSIRGG